MRISTCKYMRYKMKIAPDNGQCSLCKDSLETLEHIFLNCSHTKIFCNTLFSFIKDKIDREFRDSNKTYLILCNHSGPIINYLLLTAKWYISRNFQSAKALVWEEYVRYTKFALNGEKLNVRNAILEAFTS